MSTFTQAAISYHGIPPDVVVRSDVHTGDDGVLYLTVQILLKDEDMEPIVKRMGQLTEQAQESPPFVPDDALQLGQLRDDYSALTPAERGKYGSFARYKAHRMSAEFEVPDLPEMKRGSAVTVNPDEKYSEGVGGRKVQHVDVAEEQEAVSELPAAVWVADADVELPQALSYSDVRTAGGGREYLLQVGMLTPEQKAKYCGEQKP